MAGVFPLKYLAPQFIARVTKRMAGVGPQKYLAPRFSNPADFLRGVREKLPILFFLDSQ
jgi:hypothetical protein